METALFDGWGVVCISLTRTGPDPYLVEEYPLKVVKERWPLILL